MKYQALIPIESRLERGRVDRRELKFTTFESRLERGRVDRRELKFTTLNTLLAGVSIRIKTESEREGKTNQPRK